MLNIFVLFSLFLFNRWNGVTMLLATMICFVLALYMMAEYNVVITEVQAAQNTTEIARNATGHIISNTTQFIPASNQTTIVIDSTHVGLGWLYMAAGLIFFVIWIWRAFF